MNYFRFKVDIYDNIKKIMKKIMTLLGFLSFYLVGLTQSNQKLIDENGWNIFQFGKPISNYNPYLKFISSTNMSNTYVFTRSSEIKYFQNLPISNILLAFDTDNKLVMIKIYIKSDNWLDDYLKLNKDLQLKYGLPESIDYSAVSRNINWGSGQSPLLHSSLDFICNENPTVSLSVTFMDFKFYGIFLLMNLKDEDMKMVDEDGNPLNLIIKKKD